MFIRARWEFPIMSWTYDTVVVWICVTRRIFRRSRWRDVELIVQYICSICTWTSSHKTGMHHLCHSHRIQNVEACGCDSSYTVISHNFTFAVSEQLLIYYDETERGFVSSLQCCPIRRLGSNLSVTVSSFIDIHQSRLKPLASGLSLIHIWRCRRSTLCRSRWSPYH